MGRFRCRAVDLALALFLLMGSNTAFCGKKAPKLNGTIDLPQTFEVDFQFAAKQRAQLGPQKEVPVQPTSRGNSLDKGAGFATQQSRLRSQLPRFRFAAA